MRVYLLFILIEVFVIPYHIKEPLFVLVIHLAMLLNISYLFCDLFGKPCQFLDFFVKIKLHHGGVNHFGIIVLHHTHIHLRLIHRNISLCLPALISERCVCWGWLVLCMSDCECHFLVFFWLWLCVGWREDTVRD